MKLKRGITPTSQLSRDEARSCWRNASRVQKGWCGLSTIWTPHAVSIRALIGCRNRDCLFSPPLYAGCI